MVRRDNTYYLELGIDIGIAMALREVLAVLDKNKCVKTADHVQRALASHVSDHPEAIELISQSGRN
jgi:hypothetical protein